MVLLMGRPDSHINAFIIQKMLTYLTSSSQMGLGLHTLRNPGSSAPVDGLTDGWYCTVSKWPICGLHATPMESVFRSFGRNMHTCGLLEVTSQHSSSGLSLPPSIKELTAVLLPPLPEHPPPPLVYRHVSWYFPHVLDTARRHIKPFTGTTSLAV